jgi:hypothetical protein
VGVGCGGCDGCAGQDGLDGLFAFSFFSLGDRDTVEEGEDDQEEGVWKASESASRRLALLPAERSTEIELDWREERPWS